MYNLDKFFYCYNLKFKNLTSKKKEALKFLLDRLSKSKRINTIPKHAYVLATIKWETADTFEPITEYGSEAYLKSKKYWPYIGRGYVQLTWKHNYECFGKALNIDLVNNPHLANDKEIAWKILEMGMTDDYETQTNIKIVDPNFTSKVLEDYFNKDKCDYLNARNIINPKDYKSYKPIAEMAKKFYDCLVYSLIDEKIIPKPKGLEFIK